jgi:hypothetical protein
MMAISNMPMKKSIILLCTIGEYKRPLRPKKERAEYTRKKVVCQEKTAA